MRLYKVYRPLKFKDGPQMLSPGTIVWCTKTEAMAINTMQPMTLREVTNDTRQGAASHNDENLRA